MRKLRNNMILHHVLDLCPMNAPRDWCFHSMFNIQHQLPSSLNHRVSPKLLRSSIRIEITMFIETMVPRANPSSSLMFSLTPSVFIFDVAFGCSPSWSRNTSTNVLPHMRSCDNSSPLTQFLAPFELYRAFTLRYLPQNMRYCCTWILH